MKTKKIPYLNGDIEVIDQKFKSNIFTNTTGKVPHVVQSIPIQNKQKWERKSYLDKIRSINKNYIFFPKFYWKELKRYFHLSIFWFIAIVLWFILGAIAFHFIVKNARVNNSLSLFLLFGIILIFILFIRYLTIYINYFNEAKTIDFSKGKIVSISVNKLYKRLKSAHININWMCLLSYTLSLWTIFINYFSAWVISKAKFGDISYQTHLHHVHLILLFLPISVIFLTLFLHVTLLVTNYFRATRIDNFYGIQIVSDNDINEIKKSKNKRNFIIFFTLTLLFVFVIILIIRHFKKKKRNN